jgi:hypothetical protein
MRDDWERYCNADDLLVKRGRVQVNFAGGRTHTVRVHPVNDDYLLTADIIHLGDAAYGADPYQEMWTRNRRSVLVGFRIDDDDILVAHGWTPKDALTAEAFQLLIRTVAREADRYEFQLTGSDKR